MHIKYIKAGNFLLATLLLVIPMLLNTPTGAQFPGLESRDFALVFRINGYEQEGVFGEPSSLALDEKNGLLYIADSKAGSVDAFSLQGVPKFQFDAGKGLKSPIGLAVDKQGSLYISEDGPGPIKIIDSEGETSTFDLPTGEGQNPPRPGRMVFDKDSNLYVVDRANSRICVLDSERHLKFEVGKPGSGRGEFKSLQDVAVDQQGRIYALDSSGTPVQVFDKKGKYLYRFGFQGSGMEDLLGPSGLFVDRNCQAWIADRGQHTLKVFDRSGTYLRRFGSYGVDEGVLFQPVDAEMDKFGRIYVAEAGARRVQVFSLRRPFEPLTPSGL